MACRVGQANHPVEQNHTHRGLLKAACRDWNVDFPNWLGLPITLDHAERQASLPWNHRDPFDRLLVAQAQVAGVPLVSADPALDAYGIARLW